MVFLLHISVLKKISKIWGVHGTAQRSLLAFWICGASWCFQCVSLQRSISAMRCPSGTHVSKKPYDPTWPRDMIIEYDWSLPILTRCYTSWPTAIMTHSLQLCMSRSPCPNCVRWSSHSLDPHLAWLAECHSGHLLSSNNMHAAQSNTLPPKK